MRQYKESIRLFVSSFAVSLIVGDTVWSAQAQRLSLPEPSGATVVAEPEHLRLYRDLRGHWGGDIVFLPAVSELRDFVHGRMDLEARLHSQDAGIRTKAAESLGGCLDFRAVEALNPIIDDPDPAVGQAARHAIQKLCDYYMFTSQRPPGSILNAISPVRVDLGNPYEFKDRNGHAIEGTLVLWEHGGELREMIPAYMWVGQQLVFSRIAGLSVDQRLIGGNLVYFLFAQQGSRGFSLYYWPTATIYDNWEYSHGRLTLGSDITIDFLDLQATSAAAGQVSYRLLSPGRLLVAMSSTSIGRVLAVGEQFKDQSGGLISVRDWLIESKVGDETILAQIQPDPPIFRPSRAAFMDTSPRDENQAMGTLQISDRGIRVLACVNAGMPEYIVRKERCIQSILIPEPENLHPAVVAVEKALMRTSGLLPEPKGASYEGSVATDLRTQATVQQVHGGVWSLQCLESTDRIAWEAKLDCSNNKLGVQVLLGEGSVLRFRSGSWVTYQGMSYSGGAIEVRAGENKFLEGTRRKADGIVEVYSNGQWRRE